MDTISIRPVCGLTPTYAPEDVVRRNADGNITFEWNTMMLVATGDWSVTHRRDLELPEPPMRVLELLREHQHFLCVLFLNDDSEVQTVLEPTLLRIKPREDRDGSVWPDVDEFSLDVSTESLAARVKAMF